MAHLKLSILLLGMVSGLPACAAGKPQSNNSATLSDFPQISSAAMLAAARDLPKAFQAAFYGQLGAMSFGDYYNLLHASVSPTPYVMDGTLVDHPIDNLERERSLFDYMGQRYGTLGRAWDQLGLSPMTATQGLALYTEYSPIPVGTDKACDDLNDYVASISTNTPQELADAANSLSSGGYETSPEYVKNQKYGALKARPFVTVVLAADKRIFLNYPKGSNVAFRDYDYFNKCMTQTEVTSAATTDVTLSTGDAGPASE